MNRLRHYPFVLAWWIATRNSFSQVSRLHFLAATGIGLVAVIALQFGAFHSAVRNRLQWINEYEAWIGVLAAAHAAFLIAHRRRLSTRELRESWLAATELGASTLKISAFLRTVSALVVHVALAICLLLILAALRAMTMQMAGRFVLLLLIGALFGGACGWAMGRPRAAPSRVSKRFTYARQQTRSSPIRSRFVGLSHWPISQVLFWSSPSALRWPFIAAAMSVPLGASAGLGLMIIGSWALVLYMVTMLMATLRSAREAGRWLYPTQMRLVPFALALIGRPFVHQIIASAIMTAILVFSDSRPGVRESTAGVFLVWIVLSTTASVIAVAKGYRMLDSRRHIAIALFCLLATTAFAPMLLGPLALAWTTFYFWRGAHRV